MKYLFIGGTRDGEIIDINRPMEFIEIPSMLDNTEIDTPAIKQDMYVEKKIRGLNRDHHIYLHRGLTPDDMMDRLIERYAKKI